jgi:hypothetical protein
MGGDVCVMMIQYLFLYTSKYCNGERNNRFYGVFIVGYCIIVLCVYGIISGRVEFGSNKIH